ncbi:asparagine synthase-related protein [Actinomadura sp. 9N215]|uniref:asparagine synthase-related protein n=1 Tax=Actinomadura sp. 9N215 TaxID=3375150 RepID=UPI0037A3744F
MPHSAVPWFVVLPDVEDAKPLALALRRDHPGLGELNHPSGRPWLLGSWGGRPPVVGRAADCSIALVGTHACTEKELSGHASRVRTVHDLSGVAERVGGSVHLIATVGGRVRVQGTASGLRRVYHATADGVPVAGDRATVLAGLAAAVVDPARIAVRLIFSSPPWPLVWDSVWDGVHTVLPGHCLLMNGRSALREERWWTPPPPELPLAEAAAAMRSALSAAVTVRVGQGRTVVCDLSGLDSSSVCSLAARAGAEVVALTAAQPDVMDDDVRWAKSTVEGLRDSGHRVRHEVIPAEDSPLVYDGILSARADFDEPFGFVHNQRRFAYMLGRGAEHSPSAHFTGLGGDEMCMPAPPWLRTLLVRRPLVGLRHLRAAVARERGSHARFARRLLSERAYPAWLRAAAEGLGRAAERGTAAGWGSPPVLPGWVTAGAAESVRDALLAAARDPRLLDADAGMHFLLAGACTGAQEKRCFEQLGDGQGTRLAMPFFDDAVLSAALSARPADRNDPGRYKPVLVEAMRGIVPAAVLGRETKSDTATTAVLGSRRHRDQLTGLAEGAHLAGLGLVDAGKLRRVLHEPIDIQTPHRRIEPTIGCEMWLRNRSEEKHVRVGA